MTAKKMFWAIADQGSIAMAFFFVTFFLARELPQDVYGAFAMAYSILTLSQLLYQGFFYEPIAIIGIDKFNERFWKYALKILLAHFALVTLISACYGIAALLIENSNVKFALIGLAISSPFILLYGIVRRFLYANFLTSHPRL